MANGMLFNPKQLLRNLKDIELFLGSPDFVYLCKSNKNVNA